MTLLWLLACGPDPYTEARAACGLSDGETRPFAELATVPDDACAARLLDHVGFDGSEDEGHLRVAEGLWALLAGDWGAAEPDAVVPAVIAEPLADQPGWGDGPLSRPLYALVTTRVQRTTPLDVDWRFRFDRWTGALTYGAARERGDPEDAPARLLHAVAHADLEAVHLDCLEREWVEEGPDAAWGGAASAELWLKLRLFESASDEERAALGPRLATGLGNVCELSTVPAEAWARMGVELL